MATIGKIERVFGASARNGRHALTARFAVIAALALLAGTISVFAGFDGRASAQASYSLELSLLSDRSAATPLQGATVVDDIFVFVTPDSGITKVEFFFDDPTMSGPPSQTENIVPYDMAGGSVAVAVPFNTNTVADGLHEVTARITLNPSGQSIISSVFTVANSGPIVPALVFSPDSVGFSVAEGAAAGPTAVSLGTNDAIAANYSLSIPGAATWLTVTPLIGTTPASLDVSVNSAGLAPGFYSATVTASSTSTAHLSDDLFVSMTVGSDHFLSLSSSPNRSAPAPLAGAIVADDIFVFVTPETGITRVEFFLDDPTMVGAPLRTENIAPYDLAGGAVAAAVPFNTNTLTDGSHEITARITLNPSGQEIISAVFTVANSGPIIPALVFSPDSVGFSVAEGAAAGPTAVSLGTNDAIAANYSLSIPGAATWLTVTPLIGTTPASLDVSVNSAGLAPGFYSATVTASSTSTAHLSDDLFVTMTVGSDHFLSLSSSPNRSAPVSLAGAIVADDIFVFVTPETGISIVQFYVDDPTMAGAPFRTEGLPPYDLAGGSVAAANAFDTNTLSDGLHEITARITLNPSGIEVISSTFTVNNTGPVIPSLVFTPATVAFSVEPGFASGPVPVVITTSDLTAASYTLSIPAGATWLTVAPLTGTSPDSLGVSVDSTGLAVDYYNATVTASAPGYADASLLVTLQVGDPICLPLTCADVLVELPYQLDFNMNEDKLLDGAGIGTGFSWFDKSSLGSGYIPANLDMDTANGVFKITTTAGIMSRTENDQDNALAVGVDAPSQISIINTIMTNIPAGSGNFEQAGLWFGNDEQNYVKLIVMSLPGGTKIFGEMEIDGVMLKANRLESPFLNPTGDLRLELRVDPFTQTIFAAYELVGIAPPVELGSFSPPGQLFSFDGARIDPDIGTDSFAGIFATHRNGPAPLVYTFESFSIAKGISPLASDQFTFGRSSYGSTTMPTALTWGPDDRLYVAELTGSIFALTYDSSYSVIARQNIASLNELTLGLTIDPDSTPTDVILWTSHSQLTADLRNAGAQSSKVSKITGVSAGTPVVTTVIDGLPRSAANHSINSLHFGPDGRLYIAVGGNTGAGAEGTDPLGEFGLRPEMPLSAALVVADVKDINFDGACTTPGILDTPTCDVTTYSTGLRNMYDFVFHSNGSLYGPDNGLGVTSAVPPVPTAPCAGPGTIVPPTQSDKLQRLVEGGYYGHPNPSIGECVFYDGSLQGATPGPNFIPAIQTLGNNRSANGTIEYPGSAEFCGDLSNQILIANYSVGDDITRVRLSADGLSVLESSSLVGDFNDPLPITVNPDGVIFVGEFGGSGKITTLRPISTGCFTQASDMITARSELAVAAIGDKVYFMGGENGTGPTLRSRAEVEEYDTITDTWRSMAPIPQRLDHAMVAVVNSKIYLFGGRISTMVNPDDPITNTVSSDVYEFDPAAGPTGTWTLISQMPNPVGGGATGVHNGLIYIAGGFDVGTQAHTARVDTAWTFDPVTLVWTALPDLPTPRDHLGGAVIGDRFYTVGGRVDFSLAIVLDTLEVFDITNGVWITNLAPNPQPSAGFAWAVQDGKFIVSGGEGAPNGGAVEVFDTQVAYDPAADVWRLLTPYPIKVHAAQGATAANGLTYFAGGAAEVGFGAWVNDLYVFDLEP